MSGIGFGMLGILGLLLGFTLSMAISRWDARHDVLVDESNAIGTLWLRAGLLQDPVRGDLRDTLRDYVEARIALTGSRSDREALRAARSQSEVLHTRIWSAVESVDQSSTNPATMSALLTAANELIDLHELRLASIENFLPATLLLIQVGVAAVAMGFLSWCFGSASQRGRTALFLLAILIGSVLLLIMDLNRPQRGMITVGAETLQRVKESISVPMP